MGNETVSGMGVEANPSFVENQQALLASFVVADRNEIVPTRLDMLARSHDKKGYLQLEKASGTSRVEIYRTHNGITTIQESHLRGAMIDNRLQNCFEIASHFYIDEVTGMAFDASVLQRAVVSTRDDTSMDQFEEPLYISESSAESPFYLPDGQGGTVLLNRFTTHEHRGLIDNSVAELQFYELLDAISPFHETAHRLQFYAGAEEVGVVSPYASLRVRQELIADPSRGKRARPHVREVLEKLKLHQHLTERNAQAFTIAAVRRLRDLGIDITRGMSNKYFFHVIDSVMLTYDGALTYIEGPSISQTFRKLDRKGASPDEKMEALELMTR